MNRLEYWLALAVVLIAIVASLFGWRKYQEATDELAAAKRASEAATTVVVGASEPEDSPPLETTVAPFTLINQEGKTFDSKQLDGQIWVTNFFFTSCPGACLMMSQTLAGAQKANPDSKVRYVSITCDPETDTPLALKEYAAKLEADPARWEFLTGEMADIEKIGKSLSVAVAKSTHSYKAIVVDRHGKIRGHFAVTDQVQLERMQKLLAKLEAEPL